MFRLVYIVFSLVFLWSLATTEAQMNNPTFFTKEKDMVYENPPPFPKRALTARYVVHNSDWCVAGTLSTHFDKSGLPFTNVWSLSDGPVGNSTGIPYAFVMDKDLSIEDIKENNSMSMTMTEMEGTYCKSMGFDAEDPRCARVTLMGKLVVVNEPNEKEFALEALFSRHPEMKEWQIAHNFYPVKLVIDTVWILDYFGPGHIVPVKDYFNADLLGFKEIF